MIWLFKGSAKTFINVCYVCEFYELPCINVQKELLHYPSGSVSVNGSGRASKLLKFLR